MGTEQVTDDRRSGVAGGSGAGRRPPAGGRQVSSAVRRLGPVVDDETPRGRPPVCEAGDRPAAGTGRRRRVSGAGRGPAGSDRACAAGARRRETVRSTADRVLVGVAVALGAAVVVVVLGLVADLAAASHAAPAEPVGVSVER